MSVVDNNQKFWTAVAVVVLYLLAQFGVPLTDAASDAISTIVVILGPALVWAVPNKPVSGE